MNWDDVEEIVLAVLIVALVVGMIALADYGVAALRALGEMLTR
jgi:hypothetical protein